MRNLFAKLFALKQKIQRKHEQPISDDILKERKLTFEELVEMLKSRIPEKHNEAFGKLRNGGAAALENLLKLAQNDHEDVHIRYDLLLIAEDIAKRCKPSCLEQIEKVRKFIIKKYIEELKTSDSKEAFDALNILKRYATNELLQLATDKTASLRVRKSAINLLAAISKEKPWLSDKYSKIRKQFWEDLVLVLKGNYPAEDKTTAFNLLFSFGKEIIDFLIAELKKGDQSWHSKAELMDLIRRIVEESDLTLTKIFEDDFVGKTIMRLILPKVQRRELLPKTYQKLLSSHKSILKLLRSTITNKNEEEEVISGAITLIGWICHDTGCKNYEIISSLEKIANDVRYSARIRDYAKCVANSLFN